MKKFETTNLGANFNAAAGHADANATGHEEEVGSPKPTVVNVQAVPGAPSRAETASVAHTAVPKQLFTAGKKRKGKKSRKSRKGRKGKKSRKKRRTKRR